MKQSILKLLGVFAAIAFVSLTCVSCSEDEENFILGGGDDASSPSKIYAQRLEVPALKSGNVFIQHSTRVGSDSVMTYCLEYDTVQMHSRWVAFRFDNDTRNKSVSRGNNFVDDPKLPYSCHIGNNGFYGYDRGHICASADRLYSRSANDQTFYMTNMSPQIGAFNQNFWVAFEQLVQNKGRDRNFADTLYVVKGGTVEKHQVMGYVTRANNKKVAVPKYYFMALLRVKSGAYESIGFWMEHKTYPYAYDEVPVSAIAAQALSIDDLEEKTGIDFFHNMPDKAEVAVERNYSLATWGLNQ